MIRKLVYKVFVFIVSGIMLTIYLLLLYFLFSNVYYTIRNWNNIENGIITNTWVDTYNSENYQAQMYDIKIDSITFQAKDEMESNYTIGDIVSVQPKGNNSVRILYVNGKKVGKKINGTEYLSLFFLILLVLVTIIIIKNKIKK